MSSSSASSYWATRRARDKERAALAQSTALRRHESAIARSAVASVLPGQPIPSSLEVHPVIIHQSNGARLVCRHLV